MSETVKQMSSVKYKIIRCNKLLWGSMQSWNEYFNIFEYLFGYSIFVSIRIPEYLKKKMGKNPIYLGKNQIFWEKIRVFEKKSEFSQKKKC
jgi:hypothetical protein